jgi:hypothetical protein
MAFKHRHSRCSISSRQARTQEPRTRIGISSREPKSLQPLSVLSVWYPSFPEGWTVKRQPSEANGIAETARSVVCGDAAVRAEPIPQLQQRRGGGCEALGFIVQRLRYTADPGNDTVLVHVQPGAPRIQHLHGHGAGVIHRKRRDRPSSLNSSIRAPERELRSASARGNNSGCVLLPIPQPTRLKQALHVRRTPRRAIDPGMNR